MNTVSDMTRTWLAELAELSRGGVQRHVPLAPFTSFRIGGPAEYLAIIDDLSRLEAALTLLGEAEIPFLLLGGGSNVLVSDAGVPGLTLINQCKQMHWPDTPGETTLVTVEAGAPLAGFARESINRGLAGMSWAVSIPGTVGGAVVGNAGAHGGDIAGVLLSARVWLPDGRIVDWSAEEMAFAYRSSRLKGWPSDQPQPIILSATFRLRPDVAGEETERASANIQHRRRTQPVEKSAGSIFKNPPGDSAGRLIDQAGLKGRCAGDACISEKHANFIINRGRATAADVVTLMNLARSEVWRQFGILLEPEILFVGDWSQGPALLDPRNT